MRVADSDLCAWDSRVALENTNTFPLGLREFGKREDGFEEHGFGDLCQVEDLACLFHFTVV